LILPPRALLKLAHFKLRGVFRRALTRLKQPSGLVFAILGGGMVVAWLASILMSSSLVGREALDPVRVHRGARLGAMLLTFLGASSALSHRGLFLPKEEVERLFSAPLKRSALVRYRLSVSAVRSLFASLLVGLLVARRAPEPAIAFVGVLLGMQAIGVIGQLTALVAGALEKSALRRFAWGWFGLLLVSSALAAGLLITRHMRAGQGAALPTRLQDFDLASALNHPVFLGATLPFEPWARVVSATSWGAAWPWIGVAVLSWLLLWELCARVPVDFRELSLETSASISERIRRQRSLGGGASGARLDPGSAARRVPWLFGRGPARAIAWRKLTGILRRARGTLFVSLAVLLLLSVLGSAVLDEGGARGALSGALLLSVMGTVYLSGGLRFDFREELDRMEQHKGWPLRPSRVFAATLLPQVLLISCLLLIAVGVLCGVARRWHPALYVILPQVPLFVATWTAIDNALFLVAPVRSLPGQEGVLHNAGRSMVLMLVRLLFLALLGVAGAAVTLPSAYALKLYSGLGERAIWATLGVEVALLFLGGLALLVFLGGRALARFDVARDRA